MAGIQMVFAAKYRIHKFLKFKFLRVVRVDHIMMVLVGVGVVFASLGLGEAVYRLLFLDFDGATDRLPIELLFGCAFAFAAAKLATRMYRKHVQTSASMKLIRNRNSKIRNAVSAIAPVPYSPNQQAIRVIREQVDRIECELSDLTRQ